MKRLGENVFQVNFTWGDTLFDLGFTFAPLLVALFFLLLGDKVIGAALLPGGIYWWKICSRYLRKGVVLDNERGVIVLHKWTWNIVGPQKFEEIQMSEIMGVNRDINITTKTTLINNTWQTTETKSHNIVLQGKFGSRRFTLASLDDWNLFMTLLYGEGQ
ncbi:MAG: hypothetical protein LBI60_01010 [Bacteroidales bacterium]|jgi:hypothetical protein|nr:hypothetical protein [Bacteroidales bacterium]